MKKLADTLVFFADNWDCRWRRRQQLAWGLAKSGIVKRVIYVERPLSMTSFIKFLINKVDWEGKQRWERVISQHSWVMRLQENISLLATFAPLPARGPVPFFNFSEFIRDRWLLSKLRKHFEINKPIVCITHPQISIGAIRALDPSLIWYDCTEDFSAWPGLPNCVRSQIKETDAWLTSKANVITAVSHLLYQEKKKMNSNTHWLPNAVDIDLFMQPKENLTIPKELQDIQHPILTFVGGMCDWAHDWELLDQVATLRPNWTIVLIGNLNLKPRTVKMLKAHGNILCLGQKPYSELPNYLANSDICFLFYRTIRKNDTGNSQKLFLYLAAGKPIVSTLSADIESYGGLVKIVSTAGEFVVSVECLMASDSPGDALRRRESAMENSWQRRVEQIRQILNDMNGRHDG